MSMPFKIWGSSALQHVILWSIKTIKINPENLSFQYIELNTSSVLLSIIVSPFITIFFWSPFHASFLIVSSINFWSYNFWSRTCCFQSSSRHAIQMAESEPKIISLYLVMVSLMASSSSSFVFIQFRRDIFNFFASASVMSCSFIYSFVTAGRL